MRRLSPALPWITRGAGVLLAVLGLLVFIGTVPSLAGGTTTLR